MLPQFCYLVTCFGLTVWTHAPFVTLGLYAAFQAIIWIAGISVWNYDDFIFWQFLTALAGVLVAWALLLVTRAPQMLRFETSYVGTWAHFLLWLAFFLAAELFYGFFPPPQYPWGIIGTGVSHLIIQCVLWGVMYYNNVVFYKYLGRKYFFGLWALVLFAMEMTFFLAYVLEEKWTAYIAAGVGCAILVIMALVFPLSEPYSSATAVSGEPLIGPKSTMNVPGDSDFVETDRTV